MQTLETKSSRPRSFETETRPVTEIRKNWSRVETGIKSRDSITDEDPLQQN